jgi:hypothetical protein
MIIIQSLDASKSILKLKKSLKTLSSGQKTQKKPKKPKKPKKTQKNPLGWFFFIKKTGFFQPWGKWFPLQFFLPCVVCSLWSQRYGSGSFYHHAKIVRKTLIPNFCHFSMTFYLRKMM